MADAIEQYLAAGKHGSMDRALGLVRRGRPNANPSDPPGRELALAIQVLPHVIARELDGARDRAGEWKRIARAIGYAGNVDNLRKIFKRQRRAAIEHYANEIRAAE